MAMIGMQLEGATMDTTSIVSNLAAIAAAIQGLTEAVGYVGVAIGAMCVILAFNACKR